MTKLVAASGVRLTWCGCKRDAKAHVVNFLEPFSNGEAP